MNLLAMASGEAITWGDLLLILIILAIIALIGIIFGFGWRRRP